MDQKDLRTLKILEEIEKDHVPSQRDLARELNISLGLVNSFIKRLGQKGYFKVTTIPKKRIKYILTPKGLAEKTRLTYEFIQYSLEFYQIARQKLRVLFQRLVDQGVQRIVFYGASDLAEIAYISLQETPIEIVAVVDDLKKGQKLLGLVVLDPSCLGSLLYDKILITSDGLKKDAFEGVIENEIPSEKVIALK